MNPDQPQLTPAQAREQLAVTQATELQSTRDRKVHAVSTALLGVSMGLYIAAHTAISTSTSAGLSLPLTAAMLAVFAAVGAWVERVTKTVPRKARKWSRVGIGTTFALLLTVVMLFLNYNARTEPNSWLLVIAGALVAAVPSLVAARMVARGPQ